MGAGFALTLTLSRRRERGLSGVMPEYSAVLHPVLTLTLSRGRERGLSGAMSEYSAVLHPALTLTLSRRRERGLSGAMSKYSARSCRRAFSAYSEASRSISSCGISCRICSKLRRRL